MNDEAASYLRPRVAVAEPWSAAYQRALGEWWTQWARYCATAYPVLNDMPMLRAARAVAKAADCYMIANTMENATCS